METNSRETTPLALESTFPLSRASPGLESHPPPVPFARLSEPVRLCINRIRRLMADEIDGSGIQVLCRRPGDRINLALVVGNQPIAFNFVSEEECERAYERDPRNCSAMDHFVHNWARVARIKLQDNRSITDISHEALTLVARARANNATDPIA